MDQSQFWQAAGQFEIQPQQQWQQQSSLDDVFQQFMQESISTQKRIEASYKRMEMHFGYLIEILKDVEVTTELNPREEGQSIVIESDKIFDEEEIERDEEKIEEKEIERLSEKDKDEEKEKEVLARVNISAPPFERPRKAIDDAYYKQYCGGDEAAQQESPRRPRRGRGPPQGQASVEPQEAEPFQMRDMYMSLIDARMQSIHRGQVATVEMIIGMYDILPTHRWTMDEFHNVVAWPEEQAQGNRVGAAEASAMDDEDDEDAFEDVEDEEEEEDIDDNMG
ncbi:hypothetical protein LR48_Vigan10g071400 [Vigna angularis]|uniref:Uncharacterized protein n=1 Tax=Phaseolus angularis TaxID=3914 RepID=A0A0L9VIS6_PHAAN|nr:hypothetical protein LR48_Vigan10g071400 [Vigna angularis]